MRRHPRKKHRHHEPPKRERTAGLARFRVPSGEACDGCGAPSVYHTPLWAEPDPYLISFWAFLCERCIGDRQRAIHALQAIRARGWARPGLVVTDDEMPPRSVPIRRR